jgi:lysophospholipase L1-like esterase
LDNAPELKSDELYWDLVHLNAPGQAIASKIVLEQLAAAGIR